MADFSPPILTAVGLIKIELGGEIGNVCLCEGGFVDFDSGDGVERYVSQHETFGTIASVETITEAIDDEAPSGKLILYPPNGVAAALLSNPAYQNARMRFWVGVVSPATGQLVGEPEQQADYLLDTTELVCGRGNRQLELGFVSHADRLFAVREGMVLSAQFHKSIWPGETGLDNMTGTEVAVAWGTLGPMRGAVRSGNGGIIRGVLGGALGALF